MKNVSALPNLEHKTILGMPKALFWGFVAIMIFMTGDGIEQAFLSKQIVEMGYTAGQSAMVFTVYGVTVAIGSWLAALFADIWGPRRTMLVGLIIWILFHIGFITLGTVPENLNMMMVMYGLRGFGFPLFAYSFVVWIAYATPHKKLPTAMGWFWFAHSLGLGVFGSYMPSFTIPAIGYNGSLWLGLIFVIIGGLVGVLMTKGNYEKPKNENPLETIKNGFTILFTNKKIAIASAVRIINQLAVYGFVVAMPLFLTSEEVGFTTSQWLQIWAAMYLVNIFFNLFWGFVANKMAWHKVVQYFGCIGVAIACLLFYYVPITFGPNFWLMICVSGFFGAVLGAFAQMSAIFAAIDPENRGAAMSIHNLSAGLSQFIAPALAGILFTIFGTEGLVWSLAGFYLLGFVLANFLKIEQEEPTAKKENSDPVNKALNA
ncbi:MFS transporter [Metabacillus litoralis]|uniref:MFS transporter n=1 Tax=Metabacillus litoralis TaxID=152268 RepID=UPI0020403391|nr:MFS transporter [Metabacillus litoralis]MCM3655345.1 MFS transporter [Metabacillus litoralis]